MSSCKRQLAAQRVKFFCPCHLEIVQKWIKMPKTSFLSLISYTHPDLIPLLWEEGVLVELQGGYVSFFGLWLGGIFWPVTTSCGGAILWLVGVVSVGVGVMGRRWITWCFIAPQQLFCFWVFDVHWVVSGCVMDMSFGWRNWFGKHYLEVWNLVPLCLMWTIWGEQNQRIFEDKANS